MPIGEFCNREVVVVDRSCPIIEAARLMRNHHVGCLVVVEGDESLRVPVGIVTDRDLVVGVLAEEIDPGALTVADIITVELFTVGEAEELLDVIARMRVQGVRRAPVVNASGGLEGLIAVDDLLELLAEQTTGLAALVRHEQQVERQRRPPL
ncbi:CBS domain-containing protein [Desulfurivibrio alkaliphilus]|uniref:Putative signal transduction protein with CBS domains n=1 Tax=Desulfurivibrio alkaliphilus (strain DSM 19089 / UNIQEM U267 / AHT2) TaxID=589865 RepID=D6Z5R4_DESAT|nr:CBS domain-containing protein [Desulfurivibrio alkaliphilus]ADH86801.1 putative signal transduction protein with CBS domains [Desulfurivibrio alkaliphilus AHT 2]